MRLLVLLGAVAGFGLAAGSAAADVRFRGQTNQGLLAGLTTGDRGAPKHAKVRWTTVCRRSGNRPVSTTGFRRPLDLSTRRRLRDSGSYTFRDETGARVTVTTTISGRRLGPRRWAGSFRAVAVVRRGGRVRDRCSVRGVRWRVRR